MVATGVVKLPCWLEMWETVVEVLETLAVTAANVVDLTFAVVDGIDDVLDLVEGVAIELVPE